MSGFVYKLVCPSTKAPIYVGSTIKFPSIRLSEHISWINRKTNIPLYKYLRENNIIPDIEILEKMPATNIEDLREAEMKWLHLLIEAGVPLLNKNGTRKARKGIIKNEYFSEALQHTTCKLHPIIFTEIDKRVEKKEFTSFNAGMNKLLLKALNIKQSKNTK